MILPLLGAGLTLMLQHATAGPARGQHRPCSPRSSWSPPCCWSRADRHGPQVLWVGAWPEPLGITLVADRLSALMLLVSAVVTLAVLVYSIGQGMTGDEREDTPVSIYHPTFLVLAAGVANAFLAGDLFNLFVSFEMLLFASYVLLTLGGTGARIRAGTIYVVVNMLSSMLFLIAIAAVYAATGTVNLAQLAGRLGDLPDSVQPGAPAAAADDVLRSRRRSSRCRSGCPTATRPRPAPVTAVFAGLLTKVGVYAIIRTQTLLFPDSPLTDLLLWAALLTMVVGILGAIAQSDIKRMLSFTLVSHIGYMIFGIGLATVAGHLRRDLLRRPPHHHPDRAVPRRSGWSSAAPAAPR